mmetsp:Transcript_17525/g.25932  ORF Transcript_17525/g.25932 Transcript_17525/m.25932 type:complete len:1277 (-) Transcript_17525:60-3890(-)|eukprot:CAMPEP_0194219264 /NCGR_PEP_ID=MMETSP0156-20130528/25537_1 /TAXON_ID=33649 /ORGANISM="Thalassionema nitzschioides, Strain L26-B" /LENGTH=1276 /DNA_ID=CAMNT_0038948863 /DNA_START=91 /DNA_END=3921 /DNA_ORIENTATION=+
MFRGTTPKPKRSQSKRSVEAKKFDSPLEELQQCLDRFEELVENTRGLLYGENEEEIETEPPGKNRGFFRSRRKDDKAKSKDEKLDSSKSIGGSAQASFFANPKSKFVPMPPDDEEEMIEVLRRIAELVVMGEKAAAATQKKAEKRRLSNAKSDYGEEEEERAKIDADIALFENFFERNVLDLIVKMVTGIAFEESFSLPQSRATDTDTEEKEEDKEDSERIESSTIESSQSSEHSIKDDITFLPPIRIATQAIQSVSILVQNVSRATSLYFLLSNNYVNDLINLPLKLYSNAERFQRGESAIDLSQLRAGSPEIAELTTHYVTFLKSLALRMNAETLQFFLTYPNERSDETASSMNFSSFTEDENTTQKNSRSSISKPVQINTVEVEFPLYARALEYCAAHQDSFVRVTAMNICLNTLRLATVSMGESLDANIDGNGSSPDGVLHATALPLRERLAIAQHVCSPRLVEALVSPIFTKLAQLWGTMEELIRDIDMLREGVLQKDGGTRVRDSKMEQAKADTKRKRLTNALKDTVADVQDELELFEDVLKVGLTSLNEQSIEMMLATFVYPLLLQPLLLYFSSLNRSQVPIMVDVLSLGAHTSAKEAGVTSFGVGKIQDSAPAKTALFSLTAVFQVLSNPPLMRLLLTALFHPLAPDSSGETMIRAKPDVAGVGPDGKLCIRIDTFSPDETKLEFEPSPYSFGNITGEKSVRNESHNATDKVDESCVYVLSPALTEVLEGQAGDLSLIARTRSNPYRRAVLKCLTAGPSMFGLRQIAVLLMDAVVKRFSSKFASNILFGAGMKAVSDEIPLDERTLDSKRAYSKNNRDMGQKMESGSRQSVTGGGGSSSFMGEVVSALSLSIINVSMFYEGIWKLVFDGIASHTLLCLAKESDKAVELATKVIEQRRRMAAGFVSELPLKLDKVCGKQVDDDDEGAHEDSEARIGMHAHNIFYTSAKGKQFSVVGELLGLKESVGKTETDEYSVSIAMSSKYDDTSLRLCNFGRLQLDSDVKHSTLQIAATSAMALAQIDALSTFLKDLNATSSAALKGNPPNSFSISRMGTLISTTQFYVADVNRSIFSPISTRLGKNLLRLDEEISKEIPQPGSVVGLVGRTAIPCVCEVPESCFALLTDETSSVVSDGVKWLSLYVVFYSGYMILAEPERKGSGGNGRVVSACYLTSVSVERDDSPPAGNSSPARRLLVVHRSLDDKSPGLFLLEKTSPVSCGPFNRLERCKSTLDVWFEDENSAEHAYRVMSMKLGRAMSKRGNRLREKLAADA